MEIYLIRHTTPQIEKGVCYGQTDLALNEKTFTSEFEKLCPHLPKLDKVYSSPLVRCTQLAAKLTPDFQDDYRLKELDFGRWEMLKWNEIVPEELEPWMADFVNYRVPNGESMTDLIERTSSFFEELLQTKDEKIGIVTHAGVIRSILGKSMNLTPENFFKLNLDYGSVSCISAQKGLLQINYINR